MQFLKSLEVKLRQARNQFMPLIYRGDAVYCPVCAHSFSKFLPAGTGKRYRENAVCPYCRARERDRLTWLFLKQHPDLFNVESMRFLHVAPEPRLAVFFRSKAGSGYISADLIRKDVMVKMDIIDIQYPENYFDAIYCSHVLQDVPDDNKAIEEFFRVLGPGGWAILNVPVSAETTHTNKQPDNARSSWDHRPDEHIRTYGLDYTDQLKAAGFDVIVASPRTLTTEEQRHRMGIDGIKTGYVHFVRKPD